MQIQQLFNFFIQSKLIMYKVSVI